MTTLIQRLKSNINRLEKKIHQGKDTVGTHRYLKGLKDQLKGAEAYQDLGAKGVFLRAPIQNEISERACPENKLGMPDFPINSK